MLLSARRFSLPTPDTLANVQREMESLFGHVLNGGTENGTRPSWNSAVAMWEDGDKVYVELELPGISRDSLDLTVHHGVLRITGERPAPEGDRKYRFNQRSYGKFERSFELSDDVDTDSIDAGYTDGVLQIVLSKRPEAQPKKITLKS